jgi:hypothetical protein
MCPGYTVSKDRKFVNYAAEADCNPLHETSTGLLHDVQKPGSTHIDTLDWPTIEQNARLTFFADYCITSLNPAMSRGYLNGLQAMIAKAGPTSEIAQACTIIALHNLGRRTGTPMFTQTAKNLHSSLLRSFRLSISNEATFTSVESLITATLLGFYEVSFHFAFREDIT